MTFEQYQFIKQNVFSQLPAAMACGGVMSLVWNIFHFLRIIPKPGTKHINKIALTVWLMLITICTAVVLAEDFLYDGKLRTDLSKATIVATLLSDLLGPLQSVIVIITSSALIDIKMNLNTKLFGPKYPWLFLLTTILHLISIIFIQHYMIKAFVNRILSIWYIISFGIQYLLNFLILTSARTLIGLTVNKFCKSIEDCSGTVCPENIQITTNLMITEYKMLKEQLSFLLFAMFSVDVIQLTSIAYFVTSAIASNFHFLPFVFYLILQLTYIAFVIDDCYSALKSSLPMLRL